MSNNLNAITDTVPAYGLVEKTDVDKDKLFPLG